MENHRRPQDRRMAIITIITVKIVRKVQRPIRWRYLSTLWRRPKWRLSRTTVTWNQKSQYSRIPNSRLVGSATTRNLEFWRRPQLRLFRRRARRKTTSSAVASRNSKNDRYTSTSLMLPPPVTTASIVATSSIIITRTSHETGRLNNISRYISFASAMCAELLGRWTEHFFYPRVSRIANDNRIPGWNIFIGKKKQKKKRNIIFFIEKASCFTEFKRFAVLSSEIVDEISFWKKKSNHSIQLDIKKKNLWSVCWHGKMVLQQNSGQSAIKSLEFDKSYRHAPFSSP